jgi:ribosomal protein L13
MTDRARVYYRKSPKGVVVERDGKILAVYRSPEEMVEVHIKGLLASDQQDTRRIRELYKAKTDPAR